MNYLQSVEQNNQFEVRRFQKEILTLLHNLDLWGG